MVSIKQRGLIEFGLIAVIIITLLYFVNVDYCDPRYKMLIMHKDGTVSSTVFTSIPLDMQKLYSEGVYVDMHMTITSEPTVTNIKIIRFCDKNGDYKVPEEK